MFLFKSQYLNIQVNKLFVLCCVGMYVCLYVWHGMLYIIILTHSIMCLPQGEIFTLKKANSNTGTSYPVVLINTDLYLIVCN